MTNHAPLPSLNPEAINALNAVDLQLSFGLHGYYHQSGNNGLSTLAVDDRDYERVENHVSTMESSRGDILAREAVGHDTPWTLQGLQDNLRNINTQTPYLQTADFTEHDQLDSPALRRYYRLARDLQILDPIDYAEGLAVSGDIPVAYADANGDALADYDGSTYGSKEDLKFRDAHMVASLGDIAIQMPLVDRPQLRFFAGTGHRSGITRVFDAAGLQYSVKSFSPQRPLSESALNALNFAQWAGASVAKPNEIIERRHVAVWERNLRAKLHQHPHLSRRVT